MTPEEVRAVTVRQPFASLIARGHKTIEWRGPRWPRWTGPVLIHAGADWATGWKGRWFTWRDLDGEPGRILDAIGVDDLAEDCHTGEQFCLDRVARRTVPTGAVVAVARIDRVLPIYHEQALSDEGLTVEWQEHFTVDPDLGRLTEWTPKPRFDGWIESGWNDQLAYSGGMAVPGNVGACLTDVTPLTRPVPAKGRLGLWKPSTELVAECLEVVRCETHEEAMS